MANGEVPQLPAPLAELPKHIAQHPEKAVSEILEPYRHYEAHLRTVFAQDSQNPILNDPLVNALPLFTGDGTEHITTRARDLDSESEEEKSRYIMPLPEEKRRANGSPATVANLAEFQKNFSIFSEQSLADLNWDNVVAAGSSVVNCLLPVPEAFKENKRTLREYYHQKFCPASDVDLFLYGLTPEAAVEKMKQIERAIKDALLHEVTVVRTKYAITIASQYPVRHVQIVLRVYKSLSELLTGFDIDAAGGAYDGKQVYVTPRALASFITQINHIDLTRRSPSYENRLSKYSHRNFEVYWPDLDRSRIDPSVFERSFKRTLGLARLLVLEQLPTSYGRDQYLNKRRQERGRPPVNRNHFQVFRGNIKDNHEDEVADWLDEEEVSNYNTFSIPYGQGYNAKKIEKICYTRDLLLNAEWNQNDDREVYLHRHPAFFGRVVDVVEDCCGTCPVPATEKEKDIAKKESKMYISGKMSFLVDDPGRQEIGSFNPLTEQDWTDMAYVGNSARLCQSIVDGSVDEVRDWLAQDGAGVDTRDYTGRTPLHLAVMSSTPEVVKCLVDHGARLIARLVDGRTALHLAASRGNLEMIKILMDKSNENEEAEDHRKDQLHQKKGDKDGGKTEDVKMTSAEEDSDGELVGHEDSDDDVSMATGSFVKVKNSNKEEQETKEDDEPDIYDIDVVAWDVPCSPLHLAIAGGHEDAVKELCEYGADSILPVKFNDPHESQPPAMLTLVLALTLPTEKAKSMVKLLLSLGAICSQAESNGTTAFHRFIANGQTELIDTLLEHNRTGVKKAINHIVFAGSSWRPTTVTPLDAAIEKGDPILVLKVLNAGAEPNIKFETWIKAAKISTTIAGSLGNLERNKELFCDLEQPITYAIKLGHHDSAIRLLESGANPNTLTAETEKLLIEEYRRAYTKGVSILDLVNTHIKEIKDALRQAISNHNRGPRKPELAPGIDEYLNNFKPGTYQHCFVSNAIKGAKDRFDEDMKGCEEALARQDPNKDSNEKAALEELKAGYDHLRKVLLSKEAKSFADLYPNIKGPDDRDVPSYNSYHKSEEELKPYEYTFSFSQDDSITEERQQGYIELMEACWVGDLDRIKALTLKPWGPESKNPPLKVAIYDHKENSPFSLAFLRGHHVVAKAILEISKAQWLPKKAEKLRYRMRDNDDDDDDGNDNDSDASEPDIVTENVHTKFVMDNIGDESMQISSTIKPQFVLGWDVTKFVVKDGEITVGNRGTLFEHCFEQEDAVGMNFLIDLAQYWTSHKFNIPTEATEEKKTGEDDDDGDEEMDDGDDDGDDDDGSMDEDGDNKDEDEEEDDKPGVFNFPINDFQWGIAHGKTDLLSLVIQRTGAGVPLNHLVEQSGVKVEKKPKYYQGLTVYGKKRSDWANAGRNDGYGNSTHEMHGNPLLHAAASQSLESVKFFLSDKPRQLYIEFGESKTATEDRRIKRLNSTPDGYNKAVTKWLSTDSDLAIHSALSNWSDDEKYPVLEYLTEEYPAALEKKQSGRTPLLEACSRGFTENAKILIKADANLFARDMSGANIIHLTLLFNRNTDDHIRRVLELVEPNIRDQLFQQRKNLAEGGTTPIHSWITDMSGASGVYSEGYIHQYQVNLSYHNREKDAVEILQLLLDYTKGEGLELLNGAGDTCLHTVIMRRQIALARVLINYNPKLLVRENAVGRTPAEIAQDNLTALQFSQPEDLYSGSSKMDSLADVLRRIGYAAKQADWAGKTDRKNRTLSDTERKEKLAEVGLTGDYKAEDVIDIAAAAGFSGNYQRGYQTMCQEVMERVIWDLCTTAMEKHSQPRRLVSLNEANDVARRLGEQHTADRYCSNKPDVPADN